MSAHRSHVVLRDSYDPAVGDGYHNSFRGRSLTEVRRLRNSAHSSLLAELFCLIVNAVVIYRYFLKPKKRPRWKFLTTPRSALLGDVLMFLNVICLQILWSGVSASASFWECSRFNSARRRDRNDFGNPGQVYCYRRPGFAGLFSRHEFFTWLKTGIGKLPG